MRTPMCTHNFLVLYEAYCISCANSHDGSSHDTADQINHPPDHTCSQCRQNDDRATPSMAATLIKSRHERLFTRSNINAC